VTAKRAVLAAGALAFLLVLTVGVLGAGRSPDRYALMLLVPALILRRGRRYFQDFLPFVALIILYAECRGLAHVLRPDAHFTPHLDLERWLFAGNVPASVLQEWFWSGHERWYDTALLGVARIHQFVPLTLAFVLLMRRRVLFYRFATTLIVLSFSAALTFLAYPAAPPWRAAERGLVSVEKLDGYPSSAPHTSLLTAPYDLVHDNPDAAIPSLHGGYSFLVFLFVAMLFWRTRWRWKAVCLAALYPLLQSLTAVYTGNHYVVDLLIGYGYAASIFFGVAYVWRRLGLPPADSWSDPADEGAAAAGAPSRERPRPAHAAT
jgi:membrane-associated phospholipid phosphatase